MPIDIDIHDNNSSIKVKPSTTTSSIKVHSDSDLPSQALIKKEREERIAADENLQEQITENKVVPIVEEGTIRRIELSDGSIYTIFDEGAIRQNEQGILVTGFGPIDDAILNNHLFIKTIDDMDVAVDNVLTQNQSTGEIMKRDADKLLEDIGGASYNMDSDNGILSLKIGKQED